MIGRASVKPSPADLALSTVALRGLLELLLDLRVIVLSGQGFRRGGRTLNLHVGDRHRRFARCTRPGSRSGKFVATLGKVAEVVT